MEVVTRLDLGTSCEIQECRVGVFPGLNLALVVDGMGGRSAGDVTALLTEATIAQSLRPWASAPWRSGQAWSEHPLVTAIQLAHLAIREDSAQNPSRRGQGSAVAAVQREGDGVVVAHVGDGRVYRFRSGELEPLTRDHSLLNDPRYEEWTARDEETPDQIAERRRDHQNILIHVLGVAETTRVDVRYERLVAGDLFLVCSDGLHRVVDDEGMGQILGREAGLDARADALVEAALAGRPSENIALVLVRWA